MTTSILTSIKKVVGLVDSDTNFDQDLILHINSVFATLNQLGIGPEEGFEIADATETWDAFIGTDKNLNSVKTYVSLRVRLLFDPPTSGYLVDALSKQITEFEWRLSNYREVTGWTPPVEV